MKAMIKDPQILVFSDATAVAPSLLQLDVIGKLDVYNDDKWADHELIDSHRYLTILYKDEDANIIRGIPASSPITIVIIDQETGRSTDEVHLSRIRDVSIQHDASTTQIRFEYDELCYNMNHIDKDRSFWKNRINLNYGAKSMRKQVDFGVKAARKQVMYADNSVYRIPVSAETCLTVKHIYYNNPYTIIIWNDDTKTVVKAPNKHAYNRLTGFMLCWMEKHSGMSKTQFHKWLTEQGCYS